VSERLVAQGHDVLGVDCFTDYYARRTKADNLGHLLDDPRFSFLELDLSADELTGLLDGVDTVVHLAGQPGVRLSFGKSFQTYLRHNLLATQRLLEEAVQSPVRSFVYASSSSVYGDAPVFPCDESAERRPVSPYGMTKLATEELAAVYHRDFGVPTVGLRFFTVYGPRQRPDMAFSRFFRLALAGEPLPIYGTGDQIRDFTYVDDIVDGTIAAARHGIPGSIYNLGGGEPHSLREAVSLIIRLLERPVTIDRRAGMFGDAQRTGCDGTRARTELGFEAAVPLGVGLAAQLDWTLNSAACDDHGALMVATA
jgi:nucleoside-diphosphate-sugar epimerase